ncbi:hypothetical protein [Chryseobacterium luquanense]|uniref:Uncharacterized protein n=1 Tax=Chryseobacterium luquanense TaxID=2983766 RepID=A0ABT3Y5S8_9FLAO|nr:hypothetical protein [Chryseobacterium luquanense]MCX8533493.1 hypothetical protein [Chryseobacterium luquanense]
MTKKELLKLIYEEIDFKEGELKDDEIAWKNILGAEHIVSENNIASQNGMFAWYEDNDVGFDILKLKINSNFLLEWKVPVNSMGFSYGGCRFIEFCENFLIVMYADKHRDQLVVINTGTLEIENLGVLSRNPSVDLSENVLSVKEKNEENSGFKVRFHNGIFTKEILE